MGPVERLPHAHTGHHRDAGPVRSEHAGAPVTATKRHCEAAFGRIAQKRIDYAVFDAAMTLRAVIELDDRTHNAKQDALRDSYLASAGIATIRFQSKRKPSPAEIQTALQQVQAP